MLSKPKHKGEMSYLTLSENIVAALITAARGDLSVPLGDVVDEFEAWQQEHDCHFGTCRDDVRSSLALLWTLDPEFTKLCDYGKVFIELTLSDALPILLEYKYWYSNDEGDYWVEASTRYPGDGNAAMRSTSFRTYKLKQYIKTDVTQDVDETLRFLCKLGLGEQHLRECARSGSSS